ncbi:glycosyltransferase family 2 protein [Patescibacteria group bacterium]|nr:glycosyltransferase family 2 protein [Patescibacteria group bacterium]
MKEKPKVSVIIPSWNRKEDLDITLKSIFSQNLKDLEVIVIDNGSTDGSSKMVGKKYPEVILIKNKKNKGVSIAKNQGIKRSQGEYILFCDSDIEMTHKNCISNMLEILEKNLKIGAIGGEAYIISGKIETKKKVITLNCETATYIMDNKHYQLEECGYVATCNCMMPKRLILKCGGFDSKIIYGGEDKEIGLKLKKMDYKCVIDSRCLAYHYISQSTKHRNFYALNKNRIRLAIKNYNFFHILALPILDIFFTLSPKKFKDLKKGSIDVTKYVKRAEEKKLLQKIFFIGKDYFWSLLKAYGWNIIHLPETIYIRLKKPNYLEELKNGIN